MAKQRLGVVMDPIAGIAVAKDSTLAMLIEAQRRGHELWYFEQSDLRLRNGEPLGTGRRLRVADSKVDWHELGTGVEMPLAELGLLLMRKDPPFDAEYLYATHLLQQAERDGARVFNSPQALRDHPEKLAIMEWPQFIGPTLVTRDAQAIRAFHAEHRDVILKPLDGMGGMGIFRVKDDALNLGSIIETLNQNGATSVMVQKFLPEIAAGDKRVLIIGGEPVPYCLARIPQGGEVRGNLAAGGKGVAQPLTDADRATATAIGKVLAPRGLLLIGLDIIGTRVTEINVTSPTCFREILDQTGCDVPGIFVDALERAVGG